MLKKGDKKRKILLVVYGDIHFGGVSVLLNNLLSNMDKRNLEFKLYAFGKLVDKPVYQLYKDNGVDIILGGEDRFNKKKVFLDLVKILASERFDVVHCNTGGIDLTAAAMMAAKCLGIKKRIAHSHGAKNNPGPYKDYEIKGRAQINKYANIKLTCSSEAATHMFGDRDSEAVLIPNGISSAKFTFNREIRNTARAQMRLEGKLVMGTVGRLDPIKNQTYIFDIARKLKEKADVAVLIVGSGSEKDNLVNYSKKLGIYEDVIFVESNNSVERYLNAMDIFVLPSKAEGLGIAAIEAQSMDLPVWCSLAVPRQATVTEKIFFRDIREDAGAWADDMLGYIISNDTEARTDRSKEVRASGYDIFASSEILREIYLK